MSKIVDVFIIGGGINGAGIARDAAGRGLSVILCEQGDLAGATSSASTKMVHGGLRYLEYYEFGLVREALAERERLLRIAPHLVTPLRLILPHNANMRPAMMIRAGLWLYDRLGGRSSLPRSGGLRLGQCVEAQTLAQPRGRAFAYSDARADDARLVVANALDAAEHGAKIHTRTKVTGCVREGDHWIISAKNSAGKTRTWRTRLLVNAAGPWVDAMDKCTKAKAVSHMRLVKGSHIILPTLFDGPRGFLFQNDDRRVLFALPYQGEFTLFGTTDTPYEGDPYGAKLDEKERDYLLDAVNRFFAKATTREDIIWSYSGVRALFGDEEMDASKLSREYHLELSDKSAGAPVLTVLGGKITIFRALAEKAVDQLAERLGHDAPHWTGTTALPGGDMEGGLKAFETKITAQYPFLPEPMRQRLIHAYGTRITRVLGTANSLSDLGVHFGADLYAAEVDYLKAQEWASCAEDVLWRRTKRGLFLTEAEKKAFSKAF
ncbi:MAG: glycerol-3-phosphate dehydrogenase [Robiginitomaculum sp.]|nr:MAG: glycerol-3-phosphate dehydrogenase [Robiginitomaculum sp.]